MKSFYLMLLLTITIAGCTHPNYSSHGLIRFEHSGIVNSYERPLYIKTDKANMSLNHEQIAELKHMIGSSEINEQDKQNYIKVKYDIVTTDTATFLAIDKFILDNKKYYVDEFHQNDATKESYGIHINNNIYFSIYYDMKYLFFDDLRDYLIAHHCDNNVIQQLQYY